MSKINIQRISPLGAFDDTQHSCRIFHVKTAPAVYFLLSRSSLEPLISWDIVGTKLYWFRVRVHCYYRLHIIFSTNPVRRSEELHGSFQSWVALPLYTSEL